MYWLKIVITVLFLIVPNFAMAGCLQYKTDEFLPSVFRKRNPDAHCITKVNFEALKDGSLDRQANFKADALNQHAKKVPLHESYAPGDLSNYNLTQIVGVDGKMVYMDSGGSRVIDVLKLDNDAELSLRGDTNLVVNSGVNVIGSIVNLQDTAKISTSKFELHRGFLRVDYTLTSLPETSTAVMFPGVSIASEIFVLHDTDALINGSISAPAMVHIYGDTVIRGNANFISNNITLGYGVRLEPGNSIGTQNYIGNTSFDGTVVEIEINSTNHDTVNVTGNLNIINNALLEVTYESGMGSASPNALSLYHGKTYTNIITSTAGITGTFGGINSGAIAQLYKFALDYTGGLNINLVANSDLQRAAITAPQKLMSTGLDLAGYNAAINSDLYNVYNLAHASYQDLTKTRAIFDALYPVNLPSFHGVTQSIGITLDEVLNRRYALSSVGRRLLYQPKQAVIEYQKMHYNGKAFKQYLVEKIMGDESKYNVFAEVSLGKAVVVTPNYQVNAVLGMDSEIDDDLMAGGAISYITNSLPGDAYVTNYTGAHITGYLNHDDTKVFANGFVSVGYMQYSGTRTLNAQILNITTPINYSSTGFNILGNTNTGYKIKYDNAVLTATVGTAVALTKVNAYTESSATNTRLIVDAMNFMTIDAYAGLKFEYYIPYSSCNLVPYLGVKANLNAYGAMGPVKLNFSDFADRSASFSASDLRLPGNDYILLQPGILLQGNKYLSLYFVYNAYFTSGNSSNATKSWLLGIQLQY